AHPRRLPSFPTRRSSDLEPGPRRLLWERSLGGPLEVYARAEVPGQASCEFLLRLLCQEDLFKGLIAMDFGTSNSTVALYDPGVRSEEHTSELQSRGHLVC